MKKFNTLLRKTTRKSDQDEAEFEREVQQVHAATEKTRKVYKEMKQCIKAESDLAAAQSKLSSELRLRSSSRTEPLKAPVEGFCSVLEETADGAGYSAELQSNQDRLFVEPLKRFSKAMNNVDQSIQRRDAKKQDYDKAMGKVERLERSSASNAKMEAAQRDVTTAKMEYSKVHQQMMQELPQLYRARIDYFAPCLEASMEAELLYHKKVAEAFEGLMAGFGSLPNSDEDVQKDTDLILSQIKAIQIVGQDSQPS